MPLYALAICSCKQTLILSLKQKLIVASSSKKGCFTNRVSYIYIYFSRLCQIFNRKCLSFVTREQCLFLHRSLQTKLKILGNYQQEQNEKKMKAREENRLGQGQNQIHSHCVENIPGFPQFQHIVQWPSRTFSESSLLYLSAT